MRAPIHESVQPTYEEVADWVRNLALSVCLREHEVFGFPLRTASHWLTLMKERVPESVSTRLPSPITVHDETELDTAPGISLKKLLE